MEPFCLAVRSPLYPSFNGTPSSPATSYLKRSKAPFASGTAALFVDFPYIKSSFVFCFFPICFGGTFGSGYSMWKFFSLTLEVFVKKNLDRGRNSNGDCGGLRRRTVRVADTFSLRVARSGANLPAAVARVLINHDLSTTAGS